MGSGAGSLKVPFSIFFFILLWLIICVSDEDLLDPKSTQRNLYSALTTRLGRLGDPGVSPPSRQGSLVVITILRLGRVPG